MSKNDGGPAFPSTIEGAAQSIGEEPQPFTVANTGMSLRDWFASAALTGILMSDELARAQVNPGGRYSTPDEFAKAAYATADAMLEARK